MTQLSVGIRLDDVPVVHNSPEYPEVVQRKANAYHCPVGPYAGRAWVLVTRADLAQIVGNSTHTLSFTQAPTSTTSRLVVQNLYLISATHVTGADPNDPTSLHLVELADRRIHAERFSDASEVHRIRAEAVPLSDPYLPEGATTTWQQLVAALWPSHLGTAPELKFTPVGNPTGMQWHGQPAWWALHGMLDAIGCTTAYDPAADSFSIVQRGAPQTIPSAGVPIFNDMEVASRQDRPSQIAVYFWDWFQGFGLENDTTPTVDNWLLGPPYDRQVGSGGGPAGVLPIWSDLPRILDVDGADTNYAERQSRAQQTFDACNRDWDTPDERKVYPGVWNSLKPGSRVKAVLWRHWGPEYGMVTEYITHPRDPRPPQAGRLERPAGPWDAPNLTLRRFPTWPRTDQTVRAWMSGPDVGDQLPLVGDNYTSGQLIRHKYGESGPVTQENVWLRAVDNWDELKGDVPLMKGDHFVGRLCGVVSVSADVRPLYAIRVGSSGSGTFIGQSIGTIPGISGTCPGEGTVRLYFMNEYDCLEEKYPQQNVKVWNMCASVDSGVWVQGKTIEGRRFVDTVCCP